MLNNLKVRVTTEQESKEAQYLAIQAGYKVDGLFCQNLNDDFCYLLLCRDMSAGFGNEIMADDFKTITLEELRDMVILKRNDVRDATHTDQDNWKWYISSNGDGYVWQCGNSQQLKQWDKASLNLVDLKPIEKTMKEYLDSKRNYEFVLSTEKEEGFIEIPEGAEVAYKDNDNGDIYFTRLEMGYRDASIIWQRPTQPEALPFIDDEPRKSSFMTPEQQSRFTERSEKVVESFVKLSKGLNIHEPECTLNDQYAEIGQIRQHSHYKKDVSNLEFIDVYRVLKLFDVTDPCLQHAIKKLLCSGQRGAKSSDQDVQEAIDSLVRFQQMRIEDSLD